MSAPASLVSIVDDDESVRESLPALLEAFGFRAYAFSSCAEFLASALAGDTNCLVLDIAMPGMTGPDLHRELKRRRQGIPIVYITAPRDEEVRRCLLQQGAVECLFKPFSEKDLLDAVTTGLRVGRAEGLEGRGPILTAAGESVNPTRRERGPSV